MKDWEILDLYFKDHKYPFTNHHLDSFRELIKTYIPQTIKSYNLPKKKEQAVIARVMDSMGITTSELNQAVQKLKKYDVVRRQRTGNDDHDFMGESKNKK